MQRKCPKCHTPVKNVRKFCPYCGAPLQRKNRVKKVAISLLCVTVLLAAVIIFLNIRYENIDIKDRETSEEVYADKVNDKESVPEFTSEFLSSISVHIVEETIDPENQTAEIELTIPDLNQCYQDAYAQITTGSFSEEQLYAQMESRFRDTKITLYKTVPLEKENGEWNIQQESIDELVAQYVDDFFVQRLIETVESTTA